MVEGLFVKPLFQVFVAKHNMLDKPLAEPIADVLHHLNKEYNRLQIANTELDLLEFLSRMYWPRLRRLGRTLCHEQPVCWVLNRSVMWSKSEMLIRLIGATGDPIVALSELL